MTLLLGLVFVLLVWFSWRYAWWRWPVSERYPRILMYHMIAPHRRGARFNGLRVPPEQFEKQLCWLREHGWHCVTVSELIEQADNLPAKTVAITFDDGYADNCVTALPLLEKYDCKATLYLVVDRFNRDWSTRRKAHHDEGELKDEAKLSDAQVRAMLASGRVELGAHSVTHANFLKLNTEQAHREIVHARHQLRSAFSAPVKSFAYPFGLYRPGHVALVREAGYSSAVTTQEGIDNPADRDDLQLRRIKVSGRDNLLAFRLRLRSGRRGW